MAKIIKLLPQFLVGAVVGYSVFAGLDWIINTAVGDEASTGAVLLHMGLLLIALVVGGFLAVLVHELGHLVCGVVSGLRPYVMVMGPFWLLFRGKQILALRRGPLMPGGFTSCYPQEGQPDKKALMVFVAGGALFSALLTACGLYVASNLSGAAWLFVMGLTLPNIIVLGFVVIPLRIGALANDARRFLDLALDRPEGRSFMALARAHGLVLSTTPPSDWPMEETWIIALHDQALEGSADRLSWAQVALYRALDGNDPARVDQALERFERALNDSLVELPAALSSMAILDAVLWGALHGRDVKQLERLWALYRQNPLSDETPYHLCKAAMAWRRGEDFLMRDHLNMAQIELNNVRAISLNGLYSWAIRLLEGHRQIA